jgi:hypothetical protein
MKPLPVEVVKERQKVIDKLCIREGFPELYWRFCIFTKEEYLDKQKKERETIKRVFKRERDVMLREIIIPKLLLDDQEMKKWRDKRGAIFVNEIPQISDEGIREKLQSYIQKPRYTFMENGDRIKFGSKQEILEVFSPRYGADFIPKKDNDKLERSLYCWDFYERNVYITDNEEYEVGFQNNFFAMRPEGKWVFRTKLDYLSSEDGFIEPYVEPIPHSRYKTVQGYKFFPGDEEIWVDENKFK